MSGRLLAEAERIDLLHVAGIDDVTDAGDDLTLADLDLDRLRLRRPPASRAVEVRSSLNVEVRDDERGDQLGCERPLLLVEAAGHRAGETGADVGHGRVAQLSPFESHRAPGRPRSAPPPSATDRGP